jgi:hypothetical protein
VFVIVLAVPLLVAALVYGGREAMRRREAVDLRRLAPLTGGAAIAVAIGALMVAGAGESAGLTAWFVIAVVVLAAATVVFARRGRVAADGRWTAPAADRAGSVLTADDRAGVASPAAVAKALGWVEARELSASASACCCWRCSGSCSRARTPAPGTANSCCRRGSPTPWSEWWLSPCTGP